MIKKFKELFTKIKDDKSSAVLYPYSTSSSATPMMAKARSLSTYIELKRYVSSVNLPVKNGNIMYGQMYIGSNISFNDWKSNFTEWTKDN